MTELAFRLPRQSPRAFLLLAAAGWFALYEVLGPASEAVVAALQLDPTTHLGGALEFFFYDTPKVLLLLTGIVFAMGMVNSHFTPDRGCGERDGGKSRHRHAVLLLFGRPALHRVRSGRRSARRDVLLSDCSTHGQ
jgi:hypothetical protein